MIGKLILGGAALFLGARYVRNHPDSFDPARFNLARFGLGGSDPARRDPHDPSGLATASRRSDPADPDYQDAGLLRSDDLQLDDPLKRVDGYAWSPRDAGFDVPERDLELGRA